MVEGVIAFVNPDYKEAFIGITTDERAVYDYDLMVKSLCENDGLTEEEAVSFIEYNTVRSLDYLEKAPVIIFRYVIEE